MKTLFITLVFMMSMTTACSKDSSDSSGGSSATSNGEYSDLKSEPLTENMTNENKSFSSPRGR